MALNSDGSFVTNRRSVMDAFDLYIIANILLCIFMPPIGFALLALNLVIWFICVCIATDEPKNYGKEGGEKKK